MEKTKLMFNNFVEWRRENDVDNIIDVSIIFQRTLNKLDYSQ